MPPSRTSRACVPRAPTWTGRAWAGGCALAAVIGWVSFTYLGPVKHLYEWKPYAPDAIAKLQAEGKTVMVDFTADWCAACKEMEEYTFPEAGVIAALDPFLLLRADVTRNDDDDKALLAYFETVGPPTIAFYDRSGRSLDSAGYTLVGYTEADEFAAHVAEVAAL